MREEIRSAATMASAHPPVGASERGDRRNGRPKLNTGRPGQACLQLALVLVAVVLVVNPLVVSLFVELSFTRTVYLLLFDALLLADACCGLRYARSGRRRFLAGTVGLLVALPLVMLLAEPAILVASEDMGLGNAMPLIHGDTIHRPDPLLGWVPIPGATGRHAVAGRFDVTYQLDDQGRKAISRHPGAARTIHFFGDSFTFGHGVSNEDTALNLAAREIGDRANVANWGVMGYGIEQMLLRMRQVQDEIHHGDIVIFSIITDDLMRNLISKYFVCDVMYNLNYSRVKNFPFYDGRVWRSADLDETCAHRRGDLLVATIYHRLDRRRDYSKDPLIMENADRIFAEAKAMAERRGARFEVLFLVEMSECRAGSFAVAIDRLHTPHSTLMEHCPAASETEALQFPGDRHLNPAGNRWQANAILDFLNGGLLGDSPSALVN